MKSLRRIAIAVCIGVAATYALGYVDTVGLLRLDTGPTVREMRADESLDAKQQ